MSAWGSHVQAIYHHHITRLGAGGGRTLIANLWGEWIYSRKGKECRMALPEAEYSLLRSC